MKKSNKKYLTLIYPLDLPDNLPSPQRTSWNVNLIEALEKLNKTLQLSNFDGILHTDHKINEHNISIAKRYHDDALLSFCKNGKNWELLSRNYYSLAANIMAIADYLNYMRMAEKHNIQSREVFPITIESKIN